MKNRIHPNLGGTLSDLLDEDGSRAAIESAAVKRVVALQIADAMEHQKVTKTDLARRMRTSRVAVDRLLDTTSGSVTLGTLQRAASALGCRLSVQFM